MWCHNTSTTKRITIDIGSFVVGLESYVIKQESDANFDSMAPCTVRWSFHKPGSMEQLGQGGEKEISADKAQVLGLKHGMPAMV